MYSLVGRRILRLPLDIGVSVSTGLILGFALKMVGYFVVPTLLNPTLLDMYQSACIIQQLVVGIPLGLCYGMLWLFTNTS